MKINEVCKLTGLTKKAIEYYQIKKLISPIVGENGYRDFTEEDVERLKTIAILKKLDLSIDEIKQELESKDRNSVITKIRYAKQLQAKLNGIFRILSDFKGKLCLTSMMIVFVMGEFIEFE